MVLPLRSLLCFVLRLQALFLQGAERRIQWLAVALLLPFNTKVNLDVLRGDLLRARRVRRYLRYPRRLRRLVVEVLQARQIHDQLLL